MVRESGPFAGEASRWSGCIHLAWLGFGFQRLNQNALHAAHIDQIDTESHFARRIEASGGVALAEAQQLLALPEPRPWEGLAQQTLGKLTDGRTKFGRLALDTLRSAQGVGGALGWVIGWIS